MSFERKRFLGLTVIDFNASVGWNDTESSVTITLAPEDGETIEPYTIGEPYGIGVGANYEFSMGSFTFTGFLDRVIEKHSASGNIYEVKLNDGKDLIRNVECITGLYGTSDPKEDAPIINLFNVFRYFESKQFGNSQTNETGMPYYKFEEGVNYLSAKHGIVSAGKTYSIKLDFASKLPKYYRVDIPTVNLMDVISKICDDLGLLYRVELNGNQFTIKTVSLAQNAASQRVNGVIKDLAKDRNVLSWDAGVESTNNINSNFMLWGGQKEHTFAFDCWKPGRMKQFLGYDINGTPYWVSTNYKTYTTTCPKNNAYLYFDDFDEKYPPAPEGWFHFPIKGIEDIILSNNGLFITLDMAETAIILGGQQDLWELYLEIRQDQGIDFLYEQIYLKPPRPNIRNIANFMGFGGSEEFPVKREFGERENDVGVIRGTRVFSYLKQALESYLGKSFMVPVNFGQQDLLYSDYNINSENPTSKTDGLLVKTKLESYVDEDALTPTQSTNYNVSLGLSYYEYNSLTNTVIKHDASINTSTLSQTQYKELFSGPTNWKYDGNNIYYYTSAGKPIVSLPLPFSTFNSSVPFSGTMGPGSQLTVSLQSNSITETPKKIYNIVPTDSGWTEPSLLYSLINSNVPKEYIDGHILDANGKTNNYMTFKKQYGNFVFESSEDSFVVDDILYVKCSINPEYAIIDGKEHISVTLNNAITVFDESKINELGYFALTNCFFGISSKNDVLGQSISAKTGILPLRPSGLLANFKSTRNDFYGPWYFGNNVGGKTVVEKDDSLVPWTFNSSSILETAASGKLKDITPIPYMETGTLTKVGIPDKNLGDEIVANGPILTSLSCTYGASGVTTQYSFRTFTPKFGLPSRYINERLKKTAIKAYSDRKNILALFNEAQKKTQAINRRNVGFAISSFFLDFLGRRNDRFTPHSNIVMAQINAYGSRTKTLAATMSNKETNASIHVQSGDNFNKGAISLDGIFSPFRNFCSGNLTSYTKDPNTNFANIDINIPNSYTYNPFRVGSYISSFLSDDGYEWNNLNQDPEKGYNEYNSINRSRPIAIRGPIMVSGWGTDLFTKQTVPNANAFSTSEGYAGPVDLMWDSLRSVWTSHDVFEGIVGAPGISRSGQQVLGAGWVYPKTVLNGVDKYSNTSVFVLNTGKYIPTGSPVVAKYSVFDGNWYVEGQGCETRYSLAECFSEVVPSGDSDFKVTRGIGGDAGSCLSARCYDLIETNGFTGDHIALTSPAGASITATFKNGLLKKTVQNPAPTTTTQPPPPTYKWYSVQNVYGCYECFSYLEPPETYGAEYDDAESCNLGVQFDNSTNPNCSESYCLDTYTANMPPYGPDCRACVPYYEGCGGTAYIGLDSLGRCEDAASVHNEVNCTTTTTTVNPNCVDVISSVTCNADGSITTETVSVLGCGYLDSEPVNTTSPPVVYQSDFTIQLMKLEIESLKQQLSNIYNALEAYGIKINGQ